MLLCIHSGFEHGCEEFVHTNFPSVLNLVSHVKLSLSYLFAVAVCTLLQDYQQTLFGYAVITVSSFSPAFVTVTAMWKTTWFNQVITRVTALQQKKKKDLTAVTMSCCKIQMIL